MEAGRTAAGSGRALRLDPFSLPVRFEAADEAADERRRVVDLHAKESCCAARYAACAWR